MTLHQDMTLGDLFKALWQAKIYLIICAVIAVIFAFTFLKVTTPEYRASMIVAPADGYALGDYASSIENERMSALPFWRPKDNQGASTDFYRFIHTMRGPAVAEILLKDKSVLMGINQNRTENINTKEVLAAYLQKHLQVSPIGASSLRRISYRHADPEFASALLRKIHLVADQMIRRDRRQQSQSRVDYLQNVLGKTVHPDHRKGITNLLMQQEHVQMLANLDEAYVAIIVEPANTGPKADWPNKTLTWAVSLFVGLLIGFLVWSFRHSRREDAV